MKLVKTSEEYKSLVSEALAALTEASFSARWAYVEAYHAIGGSVEMFIKTKELDQATVVKHVARDVGVSARTIYYALKFYRMFPMLDEFQEGKTTGWRKIIKKYLTEGESRFEEFDIPKTKLPPMTAKGYIEYTKNSKCVIDGCNEKVDPDHFPRTTGAGALPHEVIPLCRVHHSERHEGPQTWWMTVGWANRVSIFKHFYDFIGGRHEP